jgi:type 2 lantibiotic biosynthesis protein LanM
MSCQELSNAALAEIVERSAFLHERTGAGFLWAAEERCSAPQRIERWVQIAAKGDRKQFQQRLEWDGWTEEVAEKLAGGVRLRDRTHLPRWASLLRAAVDGRARLAPLPECPYLTGVPFGFDQVLTPFVEQIWRQLKSRCGARLGMLGNDAKIALQRDLLGRLSEAARETLWMEFSVFRSMARANGSAGGGWGTPGTQVYERFVRHMLEGGLTRVCIEYPVLARVLATICLNWLEFVDEFLTRLAADQVALHRCFSPQRCLGKVAGLEGGLSDYHEGGKTTIRLTFESGLTVFYKPKNLDAEMLWYGLLEWVNQHALTTPLKVFRGVYRRTHGWVERVPHTECADVQEVRSYYRRAGVLLGLLYLLEASDCHRDNLIASGEYPVMVDMEALLQHRPALAEGDRFESAASASNRAFYWDSVFRTAMLPRWDFGASGESLDISGLGGDGGQVIRSEQRSWDNINTDEMCVRFTESRTREQHNTLRVAGSPVRAGDYVVEICEGFRDLYRLAKRTARQLLGRGGPLQKMERLRSRVIYRNTRLYTNLAKSFLFPQYLRDGFDASVQMECLCRPLLGTSVRHPAWPLVRLEQESLLQTDVPIFSTPADSSNFALNETQTIPEFFECASSEAVRRRIRGLSEDDLELQISYIRASFCHPAAISVAQNPAQASTPELLSSGDFLEEVLGIAKKIRQAAITTRDGSATWLTLAYHAEAQRWQLEPMPPRLYDGVCGTSLVLAAVDRLWPGQRFGDLARAGLKTAADFVRIPSRHRALFSEGIGAGVGGSSLIYAFVRAYEWLGDAELLDQAARAADLITVERIAEDRKFDVMSGAAGAILSLLSLYRVTKEESLLDRAMTCAGHLLNHRVQSEHGPRAWPTLGGALLTGLSHGAAGIGYALARLYEATQLQAHREATIEACAYEQSVYLPDRNNWPDLRYDGRPTHVHNSWCHGAAGIGLARAGSLSIAPNGDIRMDIDRALSYLNGDGPASLDAPCCGTLGRTETLLEAGRVLNDSEPRDRARALASEVVLRARSEGHYSTGCDSGPYIPSFHQGMAGIAYQLLRVAKPDETPSVLLWQ